MPKTTVPEPIPLLRLNNQKELTFASSCIMYTGKIVTKQVFPLPMFSILFVFLLAFIVWRTLF